MIIANCPSNWIIPDGYTDNNGYFRQTGIVEANYCERYKCNCGKIENCLIKTVYQKYGIKEFEVWKKENA